MTFDGILCPIPRKPWVGPGVRAMVTSATQVPWDRYKILCSHCKEVVHKPGSAKKKTTATGAKIIHIWPLTAHTAKCIESMGTKRME